MKQLICCPFCGLTQEIPEGVMQCRKCGGDLTTAVELSAPVFICYSRKDKAFSDKLTADLKQNGVNTWRDVDDIPLQSQTNRNQWRSAVEDALKRCSSMLVILSPEALASDEVQAEWNEFASSKRPIFPVIAEPCSVPFYLKIYQIWDLTKDYKQQVPQLAEVATPPKGARYSSSVIPIVNNQKRDSIDPVVALPKKDPRSLTNSIFLAIIAAGIMLLVLILGDTAGWFDLLGKTTATPTITMLIATDTSNIQKIVTTKTPTMKADTATPAESILTPTPTNTRFFFTATPTFTPTKIKKTKTPKPTTTPTEITPTLPPTVPPTIPPTEPPPLPLGKYPNTDTLTLRL